MRFFILFLALAASVFAADPPPKAAAKAPARSSSDAQLEAAIRARLAKSKINEDHFQVHVQSGVAILEGHTDVIQHKGVATRLAKAVGALAVDNRIQISDSAREKAAKNLEKGRKKLEVQRSDPRSAAAPPRRR